MKVVLTVENIEHELNRMIEKLPIELHFQTMVIVVSENTNKMIVDSANKYMKYSETENRKYRGHEIKIREDMPDNTMIFFLEIDYYAAIESENLFQFIRDNFKTY